MRKVGIALEECQSSKTTARSGGVPLARRRLSQPRGARRWRSGRAADHGAPSSPVPAQRPGAEQLSERGQARPLPGVRAPLLAAVPAPPQARGAPFRPLVSASRARRGRLVAAPAKPGRAPACKRGPSTLSPPSRKGTRDGAELKVGGELRALSRAEQTAARPTSPRAGVAPRPLPAHTRYSPVPGPAGRRGAPSAPGRCPPRPAGRERQSVRRGPRGPAAPPRRPGRSLPDSRGP